MSTLSHSDFLAKISIVRKIKLKQMAKKLDELEKKYNEQCCDHECLNDKEKIADRNTV